MKSPTSLPLALFTALILLIGCSPSPSAITGGKIVRVTMGDKPVMRAGETGSWSSRTYTEGRVEVFEKVIVVTELNGTKHCAPVDWFSQVVFK